MPNKRKGNGKRMSSIILNPIGVGSVTGCTPIPGARPNWQCVNDYPQSLEGESYVFVDNGTQEDMYDMSTIEALQRIKITSVAVIALAERENNTQICSAEVGIRPVAATSRGAIEALTEIFVEYINTWNVNPETDDFWTIADVNAFEAGVRLISAGVGCEAQCTQIYINLTVAVLGEFITNYSPFYKDIIHKDQNYSVIAQEDYGRSLFGATTVQIRYKDPDGVTGNITGDIIDENKIIVPVSAAVNNKTGKWWFMVYAVLAGGEILKGKPFFVNVQPEWI